MDEKTAKTLEERKKRASIVLKNQKPDKIPFIMWRSDYLIYYYGYRMSQIDNFDLMFDILKRGNEDFNSDICDVMTPIKLSYLPNQEIFKGSMYKLAEDCNTVQINPEKIQIMTAEDYPEFIKDPVNTMLEKILPRRLELFTDKYTPEEKLAALKKADEYNAAAGVFRNRCLDELGLLGSSHHFYTMPVDYIFDFLRDFTGITRDIKKCPDLVIQAADALANLTIEDMSKAPVLDYSTTTAALHLAPFINPRDFEKVYWPSFKKLIEYAHSRGMVTKLLFEKRWSHLFDFLEELPKNSVIGYFERDDGFGNVCKRFGDKMMIAGGIDTNLLARGTKEECVAGIKSVIDEYCRDGGVMLTSDMPLVYEKDAIPENFKAVVDTIHEYGRY